jgi:hypothetical protein
LRAKLQAAQQRQFDDYAGAWRSADQAKDVTAAEHLQDEIRQLTNRAEDPAVVQSTNRLEKEIDQSVGKWLQVQGDKAAYDAAVNGFFAAKDKRDANALSRDVLPKFQKIASASGIYRDPARMYVTRTIPETIAALKGTPRLFLPALSCAGSGPGAAANPGLTTVSCAQLDPGAPLQWSDSYSVEFPESGNQPGKLPYTLKLIVTLDPTGKVKVDKDGNVDKDFLIKAEEASKNCKTSILKSGGKPVTVRFRLPSNTKSHHLLSPSDGTAVFSGSVKIKIHTNSQPSGNVHFVDF